MSSAAVAAPMAPVAPSKAKGNPADFVRSVVGRPVVVRLSTGVDYRGVLVCLDGHMNIALEQAEEYVDGALKAKLGDCFIRGNNGAGAAGGRRSRIALDTPPPPIAVAYIAATPRKR